METKNCQKAQKAVFVSLSLCVYLIFAGGCNSMSGYSNQSLFAEDIDSVCLEMFDNQSFYRGTEYELSDALGKRIEASTPYKIIEDKSRADSVISGYLSGIDKGVLIIERESGRALDKEVILTAVVSWKNLRTGEFLLEKEEISASSSYSEWLNQGFNYGSALAANRLADRIVELMEKKWER
ncbi:MAG: hypothetical protein ISS77_06865 [Phycisphaerae bacterium]|nr:hypothetical protein [Phycisphaerae bacterium]